MDLRFQEIEHKYVVGEDFDAPLPEEVLEAFER